MSYFNLPPSGLPFLQSLVMSNKVKSPLASMAAGRVIAQYAPLPQTVCGDYAACFAAANAGLIAQYLDTMLAAVPIDFKAIQNYALRFYIIRCENALGCCAPSCTGTNGVYNMFHIGEQLSGADIELLKTNSQIFSGFVAGFERIYQDMQKAYQPS